MGWKLVRDRIGADWGRGKSAAERAALVSRAHRLFSPSLRRQALLEKVGEETREIQAARSDQEMTEEMGDLYDVLAAVRREYRVSLWRIIRARIKKWWIRGGFRRFWVIPIGNDR